MKAIYTLTGLCIALAFTFPGPNKTEMKKTSVYKVVKIKTPLKIDGKWDKPQWKDIKAVDINHYMGQIPKFKPAVQAKMVYNDEYLYVIFRVQDRYVRCTTRDINGPVWEDACVELFFAPDTNHPEQYFNLEINCCGTPLMYHTIIPRKDYKILEKDDISKIEIAHSLPIAVDSEIAEPVTWTIEYGIPFAMLKKYAEITAPNKCVAWRANLYKIADKGSNPHYITWSVVNNPEPDFHLPQFFGTLLFQ